MDLLRVWLDNVITACAKLLQERPQTEHKAATARAGRRPGLLPQ